MQTVSKKKFVFLPKQTICLLISLLLSTEWGRIKRISDSSKTLHVPFLWFYYSESWFWLYHQRDRGRTGPSQEGKVGCNIQKAGVSASLFCTCRGNKGWMQHWVMAISQNPDHYSNYIITHHKEHASACCVTVVLLAVLRCQLIHFKWYLINKMS